MYVPVEEQEGIASHLADLFFDQSMVAFSKQSANLYSEYGEYTADEIMKKVRKRIVEQAKEGINR